MPSGIRQNNILEDLFSKVLSQFKKYNPSGNLKFNNIGIFQNLKLRNLMGKIIRISHKLNFTPKTLGCYGLPVVMSNFPRRFDLCSRVWHKNFT